MYELGTEKIFNSATIRKTGVLLVSISLALSACGSPQNAVKPPAASPVKSQVVAGCTTTNAALNRPSLSSSNETGNNLSGKAFDGDLVSRWSSAFNDNEWIYVDLGSVQNICGVTLIWEAAYGSSFKVQVSNDASNWTDIYSTTTATGGTQNLKTAGSGQYVRMLGIKRGSPYGYSLHEFQVFTGATPPPTSATLNTGQNYSLQVTNAGLTNRSLRHYISQAFTEVVDSGSNATLKADASFKAVAGLADGNCYSFQSINFPSQYLRHANSRLRIDADNGGTFKADATFCAKAALSGLAGAVSLEAKNFPGRFIRHRNAEVWVEASTGGSFNTDASWKPIAAWSNGVTNPPPPPPPPTGNFPTSDNPDFGSSVKIFEAGTSATVIQNAFDDAFNARLLKPDPIAQFGERRDTFFFKPGNYGRVFGNIGFYTSVAGLGKNPDDVTINGALNVDAGWNLGDEKNATQNFWRSAENLAIVPEGGTNRWAVSQAAPMRRVHIRGNFTMAPSNQDFGQGYSSGGYLAESRVDGNVSSGSQQQWYTRDSSIGSWDGGVWNMVFSGVQGAPANAFPAKPITTLATTPVSRDKPYLYFENGKYSVFVPSLRTNASGASWPNTPGTSIPMSRFYVAKPGVSAATINGALASGLNIFFTPGVYRLNQTINITNPNTVVMGIGFPTIIPENGVSGMQLADVDGIKVSGILFDAGTTNSQALLTVGAAGQHNSHAGNPISIQDVYFRIGGAVAGKATNSLVVNSDNTIIDHIWAWRGDHGQGIGWTLNTADTGVIVNGNDVTATGLLVEHYQKYQVIWNGERGKTIFFQNEMPYDVPNNAAWSSPNGPGWASYKVADSVKTHEAWGVGAYVFFQTNPSVVAARGFEVPNTPGVKFHSLLTVSLGDVGTINNVINTTGAKVPRPEGNTTPSNVTNYP
ncbi:AbfB domain-containing protein [Deinococcus sp.]|uniref:AbfB domain-containing protein n=1 Tax=Deinococcus sp. TaxID=47478 RepID=UPI003B5AFCF3